MGNTPNNNFPYPEPTDLVKDGAQAIEDLADAIDTTLGVYAPVSSGLTLINTTSFSAVASQAVSDVFSSTYTNYVLKLRITAGASSPVLRIRLRDSGGDVSLANYKFKSIRYDSRSDLGDNLYLQSRSATSADLSANSVVANFGGSLEIFQPNLAAPTFITSFGTIAEGNQYITGIGYDANTVMTGFSILASVGTITGVVSTYGVNI